MTWTEKEIEKLKSLYPASNTEDLAKNLGKTKYAVRKKASRLNIKKKENFELENKLKKIDIPDFDNTELNWFISGFVAGEGSFSASKNKDRPHKRYRFGITMAQRDGKILKKIKKYFKNAGKYYETESRQEEWKPQAIYTVQDIPHLIKIVIPFFKKHNFKEAHKQKQFDEWKKRLLDDYNIDQEQIYKS